MKICQLLGVLCLVSSSVVSSREAVQADDNPPTPVQTDLAQWVPAALLQFDTPGMAVAVVKDGQVLHVAGYGERDISSGALVDSDTYFRLASVSKAFTAASVAILVDEGKLSWDDKVVQYLPQFRLQDPWVTAEFTIRDLLSQRSGLAGGAGDSMIWPEPSGFSRDEIVHNLRYLTPLSSFRSQYGYSNVLYITAAELVAKVAGEPWQDFVEKRIFAPLMMQCFAGTQPAEILQNVAQPYRFSAEEGFVTIPRNAIDGKMLMSAAAGGIVCRASDLVPWLQFLLAQYQGKAAAGAPFSQAQLGQMWAPHTLMPVGTNDRELDQVNFAAYGLGWRMADMHGVKVVHHTGILSGFQAHLVLVPEQQLGFVVLHNGSNSGARQAVVQRLLKQFLAPEQQQDWVAFYAAQQQRAANRAAAAPPLGTGEVLLALQEYAGEYTDNWFGSMLITQDEQGLNLQSERMLNLQGRLEPFADHSFIVRWTDPNVAGPALIHFQLNNRRQVTGFTLEPYAAEPGERHSYRDMRFRRQR
ncbi:serine hydrolase [Alishewanella sp. d11]|uniref:serine hydrolase n=1 Tax=Alishewanella sp. d11 TaxID=3414030 RepID=UPI003BF7B949